MRDVGEVHLRLLDANDREGLVRVDVALGGAVVYLTINTEDKAWPMLLENASDYSFKLCQAVSGIFSPVLPRSISLSLHGSDYHHCSSINLAAADRCRNDNTP